MTLQLRRRRLWAYHLQAAVVPAVSSMELLGLRHAPERHAQLMSEWQTDITALEAKIIELTGKPAPTKRDETQEWVKSVAGPLLPTGPKTKTGLLSTTAADYARLEYVPAARPLLDLRARKTLLRSFGKKIADAVNPATGRIHASYNISGAKTGRFSCSRPNLQNQPSRKKSSAYKNIFTAATGRILISGDLKQVELRAMAHVSGCPDMTAVFEAGGDIHLETAMTMISKTGKKLEELSADELALLRDRAKSSNFGIIYGASGIRMTPDEGDEDVATFFARFPRVKQWMRESWIESTRHGRDPYRYRPRRRGELGGKLRDYQAAGRKSAGSGHLRRFVFKGDAVDL